MTLNERPAAGEPGTDESEDLWAEAMSWLFRLNSTEPSRQVWSEFEGWIANGPRRRLFYQVEREWPARREWLKRACAPVRLTSEGSGATDPVPRDVGFRGNRGRSTG